MKMQRKAAIIERVFAEHGYTVNAPSVAACLHCNVNRDCFVKLSVI